MGEEEIEMGRRERKKGKARRKTRGTVLLGYSRFCFAVSVMLSFISERELARPSVVFGPIDGYISEKVQDRR